MKPTVELLQRDFNGETYWLAVEGLMPVWTVDKNHAVKSMIEWGARGQGARYFKSIYVFKDMKIIKVEA